MASSVQLLFQKSQLLLHFNIEGHTRPSSHPILKPLHDLHDLLLHNIKRFHVCLLDDVTKADVMTSTTQGQKDHVCDHDNSAIGANASEQKH